MAARGKDLRVISLGMWTTSLRWWPCQISTRGMHHRTKRSAEGDRRSYRYRSNFQQMAVFVSVELTKENKIADLDFPDE